MRHYIKKQDGSIHILYGDSPERYMEDTDVLLQVDENDLPSKADRDFWKEEDGYLVIDAAAKDTAQKERKLQEIRDHREPLLAEADIEINKLIDADADSTAWRAYRQALRDVTEMYKDNMVELEEVEDVAVDVSWPTKP